MTLSEQMVLLARQAKAASRDLAKLTTAEKNSCLLAMAVRLKLDEPRIAAMAKGLREIAALPDPVGRMLDERVRPNGLRLQKVATPIGVVVIIYESRPNVTT